MFDFRTKKSILLWARKLETWKIKSLDASLFGKTFNRVLLNYDTCMEQMRLVVNSIALSLYEITQTDGQRCGIFHHALKNKVDKKYARDQILNKI